jgi:PAS domain S-box-containing protein
MEINKSAGKILSGSASGEEVFSLLFRRHPIPMWIYDVETLNFLDLNDAAVEKYGYNREEFLKMTIKDIRPAENVAGLLNDVAKVQSELQHSGEWRHKLKDGRTIDVEITSQTLEYGGHKAALLVAEDITERKQSEQLVRDSEKRFRSIFDQSPVAIALLDIQGHLIISNLPLSKMLGYSTDELSKMKFADFTYPEDVDKDLNLFKELMSPL